ncbi:MBL fold metallo-hydrolase [Anaeromicropila populeti]|uniref:7,8-dihydropterin-6-yl-methyl-4-(Beta-D-ribofuranosyl)aminobenzene 5'-phosphate synthase n=1 Tax=Anaeromicropila populeti TaxID=37658 RepID=A0A1I6K9F8_9FIRM|nr:MBL fold metallo-hydrolase [Anaeromicropila populeti]SFR87862.1 7,8-dihydropterin-6-yl-methyl-4-(beta-D-ribofuranosyl)aminobenzene 5'-phosphate synthase [Anaeromicropila populeti]
MKIITLCENRLEPCLGLKASHGVSYYIEYNDNKYLYDLGQDSVFQDNANFLGIDLNQCQNVIVSHGHVDHAGGLSELDTVLHQRTLIDNHAFLERFRYSGEKEMDIGISRKLDKFKSLGQDIIESFEIEKGVWCIAGVELLNQFSQMEKGLYIRDENGSVMEDLFLDELNLAFETDDGLVVMSGCSHRGVINVLQQAQKVTGIEKIHTFVGGMHLNFASEADTRLIFEELRKFGVKKYVVGHCTGWKAIAILQQMLGEEAEIIYNYVGYELIC